VPAAYFCLTIAGQTVVRWPGQIADNDAADAGYVDRHKRTQQQVEDTEQRGAACRVPTESVFALLTADS
jgi:hypothetical protein